MNKFYVDRRVGCIAVRWSGEDNKDYPGLHTDTPGVIKYWHGKHNNNLSWTIPTEHVLEAEELCNKLNNTLNEFDIYCDKCGSCGTIGCCNVQQCKYLNSHQGAYDELVKENEKLLAENKRLSDFIFQAME